jgi:hypothetical protein
MVLLVFIRMLLFLLPMLSMLQVLDVSFEKANRNLWRFVPGYKCFTSYVTWSLGKTLLEAQEFFTKTLLRPNLLRVCILEEAKKWAGIGEAEIGVASHPHFMNPRLTSGQTGLIVPDAIRIARELKECKSKEMQARKKAEKKRKADKAKEDRDLQTRANGNSAPRMTRAAAARHASWCRKMQGWGASKRKRGF